MTFAFFFDHTKEKLSEPNNKLRRASKLPIKLKLGLIANEDEIKWQWICVYLVLGDS